MSQEKTESAAEYPVLESVVLVPLGEIVRDEEYQRAVTEKQVLLILRNLDHAALMPLLLSRRNKKLYVMDGGSRLEALIRAGEKAAPAIIRHGYSQAREADLSVKTRQVRVQKRAETFRAELLAGDRIAIELEEVLRRYTGVGCSNHVSTGWVCITSLYRVRDNGTLETVMRIIGETWPRQALSRHGVVVEGLDRFLRSYGRAVNVARVVEKLRLAPLAEMISHARSQRFVVGTLEDAFATQVVRHYNANLKSGRLGHYNLVPRSTTPRQR